MKKREMIKGVLGFSAGIGATMIVSNVVRATTPVGAGKVARLFIGVGRFAVAGLVADKAESWMGKQVDEVADGIEGIIAAAKTPVHNITNVTNVTNIDDKKE